MEPRQGYARDSQAPTDERYRRPSEEGEPKLKRLNRVVICVATVFAMVGATPVFADSPSGSDSENARTHPKTVVIDGREYGPKDGLQVDTFQFEIEPGSGSVGIVFEDRSNKPGSIIPQITWGASYAISTEWWSQLGYDGKARAAANIYSGKRIVQVCMWYTRGGAAVSGTVCSTANYLAGTWSAGPEATISVWDSLDPFAPPTIFNVSTVRINP